MKELNFDVGLSTYRLNGAVDVAFNPTDSSFAQRLFELYDTLNKKQNFYRERIEKIADKKQIFTFAAEQDAEMRQMIDGLFGCPVCEKLFGNMNAYALANGLPAWCNLLYAIMDEVDSAFAREQKATNPRLEAYRQRWAKK